MVYHDGNDRGVHDRPSSVSRGKGDLCVTCNQRIECHQHETTEIEYVVSIENDHAREAQVTR